MRGTGALRPGDAAQAELLEELLEQAFQIIEIEPGVAPLSAPKRLLAAASERHSQASFFLQRAAARRLASCSRSAAGTLEHAPDFKQRDVAALVVQIVTERIEQAGNQARSQHIHIAA